MLSCLSVIVAAQTHYDNFSSPPYHLKVKMPTVTKNQDIRHHLNTGLSALTQLTLNQIFTMARPSHYQHLKVHYFRNGLLAQQLHVEIPCCLYRCSNPAVNTAFWLVWAGVCNRYICELRMYPHKGGPLLWMYLPHWHCSHISALAVLV